MNGEIQETKFWKFILKVVTSTVINIIGIQNLFNLIHIQYENSIFYFGNNCVFPKEIEFSSFEKYLRDSYGIFQLYSFSFRIKYGKLLCQHLQKIKFETTNIDVDYC